jgi:hypothetical protein
MYSQLPPHSGLLERGLRVRPWHEGIGRRERRRKSWTRPAKTIYSFGRGGGDGHQQEHHDLFADLRAGRRPFEGEWRRLSTMTAIYGRMCTYSGQQLTWEEALNSNVVVSPVEKYKTMQDEPPVKPDADGMYARPVPGVTKVV